MEGERGCQMTDPVWVVGIYSKRVALLVESTSDEGTEDFVGM
jgi:hypothetical protein